MSDGTRVLGMLGALALALSSASARALGFEQGGIFDPLRHERFASGTSVGVAPNPGFFLAAYQADLSGVGWQSDASTKGAALVTSRHFLNADHYRIGGSVVFRGGDGQLHSYPVVSNARVYGDIAIGTLAMPVAPEHAIHVFPVLPIEGNEQDGREVLYLGRAPVSGRPAAGRTAIAFSTQTMDSLNSALVPADVAVDRVYGTTGDSGSPSFVEENGRLVLVGHHVYARSDQYLGTRAARDAVDDFVAASGHLLQVLGEGRLGDPVQGGLVVTRLAADNAVDLEAPGIGQSVARSIRFHDLSRSGRQVALSVEGAAFQLRVPGGTSLRALVLGLPKTGAGVPLELVFTAPDGGSHAGRLLIDDGGALQEVALYGGTSGQVQVEAPAADTSPPTAPTGLTASGNRKRTQLLWNASTDDIGVVEYAVFRDGVRIGRTTTPNFTDSNVVSTRVYSYFVRAYDAAANESAASDTIQVKGGKLVRPR
jgi:hypothetical protein